MQLSRYVCRTCRAGDTRDDIVFFLSGHRPQEEGEERGRVDRGDESSDLYSLAKFAQTRVTSARALVQLSPPPISQRTRYFSQRSYYGCKLE